MQKNLAKIVTTGLILTMSAFAFAGCGNDEEAPDITPEIDQQEQQQEEEWVAQEYEEITPAAVVTSDDYFKALDTFNDAADNAIKDMDARLEAVSETDTAAITAEVEKVKEPFVQFKAITAPTEYAAAHREYVAACDKMIEYLDGYLQVLTEKASGALDEAGANQRFEALSATYQEAKALISAGTEAAVAVLDQSANK